MNLTFILSIFISVFSLAFVLVGLPAQIVKNHREKRSGQPLTTTLIAVGFYASPIAFFFVTNAYLPLISFAVGIAMWGIILIQYFLYRKG